MQKIVVCTILILSSLALSNVNAAPEIMTFKSQTSSYVPDTTKDIIVDEGTVGFDMVGGWPESTSQSGYWGYSYLVHARGTGKNQAIWNPIITTKGDYELFITYTPHSNRATDATYTISAANGTFKVLVNQTQQETEWVSLGTYTFNTDTTGKVVLTDLADGIVVADAVTFVKRPDGTSKQWLESQNKPQSKPEITPTVSNSTSKSVTPQLPIH